MYDKGVIDSLPESVIKKIINSVSLENVDAHKSKWYNKPTLHNQAYKKALETTSIDLFPLIANRLAKLNLYDDNISLAVLLTELMTCNKPNKDDSQTLHDWEQHFKSQLEDLKKSTSTNPRISVILWAVHFQSATSMETFADMFAYLPPYIQIRCVKKLFQLIAKGKIQHSAESLYNLIKGEKAICLPLEIAFVYLIHQTKNPSAGLDNTIMLQLLDGREDHIEWIGIRQLTTECIGKWNVIPNNHSDKKRNKYFNGLVYRMKDNKLRLFVPYKMIDEYGNQKEYNNKYFQRIKELIKLTFSDTEFQEINETQGISYYFDDSLEPDLFTIVYSFNFKFNAFANLLALEKQEDNDDYFCECRLSKKLDEQYKIAFYWCKNKTCFRPPVRYMLEDEWESYTLLDFMRILDIPTYSINKNGEKTRFGRYILLASYLKGFAKFYEHLKCRSCGELMKPYDISNFTTRASTEFTCTNELCNEYRKIVYLNHCFNQPKCNATIDSRDSKRCPNDQYICPECGACCSTHIFQQRINNLHKTGGYLSDRLINFVQHKLGHWERQEIFCYKCGQPMTLQFNNHYVCTNCRTEYNNDFKMLK